MIQKAFAVTSFRQLRHGDGAMKAIGPPKSNGQLHDLRIADAVLRIVPPFLVYVMGCDSGLRL
jgi:hypothetical protein